jgi:hypothetical protein
MGHGLARERTGDLLILAGGAALFVSLFLTWSHQPVLLAGAPRNPTGWQVYSAVDVIFALLATALVAVALVGGRRARLGVLAAVGIAVAFVLHALSVPPTDAAAVAGAASSGAGELVAIAGLGAAVAGLILSFTPAS